MTIADTPLLLPVRKAAQFVGISKSELNRRIEDGRLRARKVGSFMRIHRDDLVEMVAALPNVGG
jgi:excisionase family DNA binding protein